MVVKLLAPSLSHAQVAFVKRDHSNVIGGLLGQKSKFKDVQVRVEDARAHNALSSPGERLWR